MKKRPKQFAIDSVFSYLDLWGVVEVTLNADVEPSTQALVSEVQNRTTRKTLVQVPPKHSHQSNGLVENAVHRVESLVQTFVAVIEGNLRVKVVAKAWCCLGL